MVSLFAAFVRKCCLLLGLPEVAGLAAAGGGFVFAGVVAGTEFAGFIQSADPHDLPAHRHAGRPDICGCDEPILVSRTRL